MSQNKPTIEDVMRDLENRGHLIEAGWVGLCYEAMPNNASEVQIAEMRKAFFAGAHFLYKTLAVIIGADHDPTDDDILRLSQINNELKEFIERIQSDDMPTMGTA